MFGRHECRRAPECQATSSWLHQVGYFSMQQVWQSTPHCTAVDTSSSGSRILTICLRSLPPPLGIHSALPMMCAWMRSRPLHFLCSCPLPVLEGASHSRPSCCLSARNCSGSDLPGVALGLLRSNQRPRTAAPVKWVLHQRAKKPVRQYGRRKSRLSAPYLLVYDEEVAN